MKKQNAFIGLAKHPFGIYLLWIVLFMLFCVIGIPLLSIGHAGGEQVPFEMLAHALNVVIIGFIVLGITSPFIYWNWYKKYYFIPSIIPIAIAAMLVYLIIKIYVSNQNHFSF